MAARWRRVRHGRRVCQVREPGLAHFGHRVRLVTQTFVRRVYFDQTPFFHRDSCRFQSGQVVDTETGLCLTVETLFKWVLIRCIFCERRLPLIVVSHSSSPVFPCLGLVFSLHSTLFHDVLFFVCFLSFWFRSIHHPFIKTSLSLQSITLFTAISPAKLIPLLFLFKLYVVG